MSYNSRLDHNPELPGNYAGSATAIDFRLRQHIVQVYRVMNAGSPCPASSHRLLL